MTALVTRSLLALLVVVAACDSARDRCDPDQRYLQGLCYDIADAAIDVATVDANGAADASAPGFGSVCMTAADCAAPTDYCAVQPPAATGYCTQTGCLAAPQECPAGWTCLDLSVFSPGQPSICISP